MEKCYVSFELWTKFFNIIQLNYGFKGLNNKLMNNSDRPCLS
jgi:hypothetical protein